MLSLIWGWIYSEIFSWGGVGAVIAAVAWCLWFFCPAVLLTYKSQLLHIAIGATVFVVAQAYFFTTGYSAGEAECKSRWDAANIKVEQEKSDLAKSIADQADARVKEANDALQKQSDSFQVKIDEYNKTLASRQGGSCPLSTDDLKQLRGIK
jgi:hypothetical protein